MSNIPSHVKALFDYTSSYSEDLQFSKGQIITIRGRDPEYWYQGEYRDASGKRKGGLFPSNFVEDYEPTTPPLPADSPEEDIVPVPQSAPGPTIAPGGGAVDPALYNLERFVKAQNAGGSYNKALVEIKKGAKRSHWIWYIFPQFTGLGTSANNKKFAIMSIAEAQSYLAHPILGPRLLEITQAALDSSTPTADTLMGSTIDTVKFSASMTLFDLASSTNQLFHDVLLKYYGGIRHQETVDIWNRFAHPGSLPG